MDAAQLESLCGGLNGATCAIKNEDDLVCRVAGKVFVVLCLRGPDRGRVSFPVDAGRFVELSEQPGVVPAHYAARPFWITLTEPERFGADAIARFVRHAYELVRAGLSRRQQATLAAPEPAVAAQRARRRHKA
ncbi:MAG: MmcQ/YjbR family DNA-binding protein [Proteobacteria bacterium]|nr:MmcQ/YjbR family DNA-binding protein [Pseudomonadota bacterium]